MKLNIKIRIEKNSPRRTENGYQYVLEAFGDDGRKIQKVSERDTFEGNAYETGVFALLQACRRIRRNQMMEVVIYSNCEQLTASVYQMKGWVKSGWTRSRGRKISLRDEWEEIADILSRKMVTALPLK